MLRYLPYIGPTWRRCFPISLSLAMFDGWGTTLMVVGLFVTLELIVANSVEPWLYGQSMGVSEIALLVSAAFWAFLWGPIGLVLSSPLTVCLVMLGRYVPQLEFLAVLLGDEPALDPGISFYQRLLARDQDEAEDLILERFEQDGVDQVYDTMLIPALRRDQAEPRAAATSPRRTSSMSCRRSERLWKTWANGRNTRERPIRKPDGERATSGETAATPADLGSSAARPTTPRIARPSRCSRICSTRPAGTSS